MSDSTEPFPGLRAVPPVVQACFRNSDPNCFPIDLLPSFLLSPLPPVSAANGTSRCAVAAATLHAAAVAVGGSMRLEIECGRTIGPGFNLCYGVPASVRDAGAIEPVISILRQRIQTFQNLARQLEPSALARSIRQKAAELEAAGATVSPNPELMKTMAVGCARLHASPTPEMLLGRFSTATVERALPRSLDRALVYLAEGIDPTDAWSALPRIDREELARQLNVSWDGAPAVSGAAALDLNVLWVTAASNIPALYANPELFACGRPVPVLLLTDDAATPSTPRAEALVEWDARVGQMLDLRMAKQRFNYKFSPEAAGEFSGFVASFRQRVTGVVAEQQKHLAYLPDLARRIALLCAILENEDQLDIGPETVIRAIDLAEWFGMAQATALSEIPVTDRRATRPANPARPDKKSAEEVMLAKIVLKAPVTRRKLWDSYNKPTRQSFQPALDALLASGKVCWLDQKHLVYTDPGASGGSGGGPPTTPKAESLSSDAPTC